MIKVSMIGSLPPLKYFAHYSLELVRELARHDDIEIEFHSFKKLYLPVLYKGSRKLDENVISDEKENYTIYRDISVINPFSWLRTAFRIKGDIVHFQWGIPLLAIIFVVISVILKFKRKKIIVTAHNVLSHETKWYDKLLSRLFFKFVDHFIVHSSSNSIQMQEIFRIHEKKISIIPHGPLNFFKTSKKIDIKKAKMDLKIPENSIVLLFFGSIRAYKGLDILIKAFSEILLENKNVYLLIVGYPWENWNKYAKLIDECNCNANVRKILEFIPSENIEKFFSVADLVVLPYKHFMAQSGVASTAVAFLKPMIVTDVGGLKDLVLDDRCISQKNNVYDLKKKIEAIIYNPKLIEKIKNDVKIISEKISWPKVVEKTVKLYKQYL